MNQEALLWGIGMIGVAAFFVVKGIFSRKKEKEAILRRIRQQWGKPADREYSLDEYEKISHYSEKRKEKEKKLDDITWNDLELDRLFMAINCCGSDAGEEYLYDVLRTPVSDPEILKERSRLADYFAENQTEREEFAFRFFKTGRKKQTALSDEMDIFREAKLPPLWPHLMSMALTVASIVWFALDQSTGIAVVVLVMIINILSYYQSKSKIFACYHGIGRVCFLLSASEQIAKVNCAADAAPHAYLEQIRSCIRVFAPVQRHAWFLSTGKGGGLAEVLLDYICLVTHIDLILFHKVQKNLQMHLEELELLIECIGKLETAYCIASLRESLGTWCRPVLKVCRKGETPYYHAELLYHPLLQDAVPNSISADRPVLITGSNASGKSTFLKTIGINAVLAQTLDTAAAVSFEGCYAAIYSSMALTDDLESGESYYMAEIRSIKRILDASASEMAVLCMVDEVLRGTNTVERIAASTKVLKSLEENHVLCFAATHDYELTDLLESIYENYHFSEEIKDQDVLFSYQLHSGKAQSRNAIRLLAMMGYRDKIVQEAEQMAEHFMKTGVWEA